AERARFAALAEDMLVRAEVAFVRVAGHWDQREERARDAISAALARV
ncbi:MAG: N-acetylglucosamine-6-phosphate deacetylase, partial [Sphingomonadales bacterium]